MQTNKDGDMQILNMFTMNLLVILNLQVSHLSF